MSDEIRTKDIVDDKYWKCFLLNSRWDVQTSKIRFFTSSRTVWVLLKGSKFSRIISFHSSILLLKIAIKTLNIQHWLFLKPENFKCSCHIPRNLQWQFYLWWQFCLDTFLKRIQTYLHKLAYYVSTAFFVAPFYWNIHIAFFPLSLVEFCFFLFVLICKM